MTLLAGLGDDSWRRLLVVLVPNDEPALVNEDLEEEETTDENTCLVGTEKVAQCHSPERV